MKYTSTTSSKFSRLMLSNSLGSRLTPPQQSETSTSEMSSEQITSLAEGWLEDHFKNPRYIAVTWGDAHCYGDASWTTAEELYDASRQPPTPILSCGMLVYECTTHLAVMSTVIEGGSAGGQVHVISQGWIISRKDLA